MLRTALFLLMILPYIIYGQIGGKRTFDFLEIPTNARVSALGGVNVSLVGDDPGAFLANPSLLDQAMHNHVSLSYLDYLADISFTSLSYGYEFEKYGIWGFGLQYIDYGDFESFDASGASMGEFEAGEFALTIGHSRQVGLFSLGGNFKLIHSSIAAFNSSALAIDLGGTFKHPSRDFTAGLVFKNLGFVISDFSETSDAKLPLDVQVGTSFKPEHMPLRFSFTAYNLARGDVAFFDSVNDGDDENDEPGTADKLFRHITIGTELLLGKNFNLRIGYNHLVRRELRLEQTSGGAGFSFGFTVRVKAFELAYSRNLFHTAGGTNYFTLNSDLGSLFKKRNKFSS